jgi:hypothetical protein
MSTNILANLTLQHRQLSDDQLLSQAKSGDQKAFGELCLRYKGILKQKIFSIVRHQVVSLGTGNVGAFIPTTHCDQHLGILCQLCRQSLRLCIAEVNSHLAHRIHND